MNLIPGCILKELNFALISQFMIIHSGATSFLEAVMCR